MAVKAAIQGIKTPTMQPTLQKFLIESALYEHVGLNFETLKQRPLHEVLDYITIANVIADERARQQAKSDAEMNNARSKY